MSTYDGGKLLPTGYKFQNYRITGVLGEGGFGITYLAEDEVLHSQVAIKEYFPSSLATRGQTNSQVSVGKGEIARYFAWGLDRFIAEARILAKIDHPNIVRVLNFAQLNGTGYMVMPYEKGTPLDKWVRRFDGDRLPPDVVRALIGPVTEALAVVHGMGLIHRDVKPANIIVRDNGSPVLIDFGAARNTVSAASQTLAAIVSTGYSPIEQYSDAGNQGPWTDIYAVAAVAYRLITGKAPPDAPSRISATAAGQIDTCPKLAQLKPQGYPAGFLAAIDSGLHVRPEMRPPTIADWRRMLGLDKGVGDEATLLVARSASHPLSTQPRGAGSRALLAVAGAGVIAAIGATGFLLSRGEEPKTPASHSAAVAGSDSSPARDTHTVENVEPMPPAAVSKSAETERETAMVSEPQRPEPVRPPPQPPDKTPRVKLEQRLASSLLWVTLKQEYPDWYEARLRDIPDAVAETESRSGMTGRSVAQLKSLRLANAEHSLLAPSEFKQIAAVYVWNLDVLKQTSDEACHDAISKGEGSKYLPLVLEHSSAPYETLIALILRAASKGKSAPEDTGKPRQSDYNMLVQRLRQLGWSQSDLQTFADPKKLSRASPSTVCRLVSEYYKAHLSLDDEAAQLRLLKESLRPIVAG